MFNPRDFQLLPMLGTNLRVLQLNIMKSGPRMEALINDHQSQDLDVLLIQEPSITTYRTHVNHSAWRLHRPTAQLDPGRFRSLIYVNRRISTLSHRQIPCDHPDIAAIKIWTANSQILLFSIYIPPVPLFTGNDASALPALTAIQRSIAAATQNEQRLTSIIVSGDFNRHHPMLTTSKAASPEARQLTGPCTTQDKTQPSIRQRQTARACSSNAICTTRTTDRTTTPPTRNGICSLRQSQDRKRGKRMSGRTGPKSARK